MVAGNGNLEIEEGWFLFSAIDPATFCTSEPSKEDILDLCLKIPRQDTRYVFLPLLRLPASYCGLSVSSSTRMALIFVPWRAVLPPSLTLCQNSLLDISGQLPFLRGPDFVTLLPRLNHGVDL